MNGQEGEWILCAAIHFDDGIKHQHMPSGIETGIVICGRRHNNCYSILAALKGIQAHVGKCGRDAQGFITSHDRYVGRKEGYKIARAAGQLLLDLGDGEDMGLISENLYNDVELYSENLY